MTLTAGLLLFVSSYAPLFGVFALLDSFGKGWPSQAAGAVAITGLLIPAVVLAATRQLATQPLHVATALPRDGDALAYVASYLVPFAAISATTTRERLALGVFVLMVAVIYIRVELFYVNPLLAIAGFRLFQITTPAGASVVLLTTRRFVSADTTIAARRLSDYVFWEARDS